MEKAQAFTIARRQLALECGIRPEDFIRPGILQIPPICGRLALMFPQNTGEEGLEPCWFRAWPEKSSGGVLRPFMAPACPTSILKILG